MKKINIVVDKNIRYSDLAKLKSNIFCQTVIDQILNSTNLSVDAKVENGDE